MPIRRGRRQHQDFGSDRIKNMNDHMNLVLPVYARAKGLDVNKLPPYRSLALPKS